MNVVGRVGSLISQGVYTVATPFHPFGGAVDIIVVEQQDGTYRSTPWYVRFGKFQGVLKGAEKLVRISVNGVEADFHMYLDNSGEAYFTREVESGNDNENNQDLKCSDLLATAEDHKVCIENSFENDASDSEGAGASNRNDDMNTHQNGSMEFHDNQSQTSSCGSPRFGTYHYESLDHVEDLVNSQGSDSEVVLVSGDGHVLLAPISSSDDNADNLELITPLFELYPGEGGEETIEHLENSTGFSRHSVELKTDGRTWDVGIQSDGGGQSSSSTEGVDPVCRSNSRYQDENEESSSNENNGDTSSVHCNQDDADSTMNRLEAFKSCLEFSQLTSEMEADNMQDDDTTSVRLVEGSAAYNGQEQCLSSSVVMDKEQGGSPAEVKTSICIPVSCSSSSVTDQIQMFDSEDNALLDEKSEFEAFQSVPNDSIHSNMNQKDEELKALGGCQESASIEAHEDIDCQTGISQRTGSGLGFEISLCGNLLHAGMGVDSASMAFNAHRITEAEYKASGARIIKNENLIVRFRGRYFSWDTAAPIILGMAVFGLDETAGMQDAIPIEQDEKARLVEENISELSTPSRRWRLWPNPFRRTSSKPLQHTSSSTSNEDDFVDTESFSPTPNTESTDANSERPKKQMLRTNIPTSEQIASLSLRDGQNKIAFIFSTRVLGEQQVDAHIYLWKWNARIVISDVDGTITKSDVLGQFMPLLGKDWTQSGVARLFSAIKENGYQLLFLSARAIVQAYLTRSFLLNLKQDGKALPNGPVVISPDGLFPSLYREVILRRPHEFKIACLEDIRALFPSDYNPFYAGFGNRETDEISYRKMGIPKGKIFIINPKGEVAVHRCIDAKSYTSLHTLVNDMFPPTSLAEQEDFNSWNFWKVPLPSIDC